MFSVKPSTFVTFVNFKAVLVINPWLLTPINSSATVIDVVVEGSWREKTSESN